MLAKLADMAVTQEQQASLATLEAIQDRVLWLATSIVHHANRVRPNPTGLKVGGHQASSASMVSIMTALVSKINLWAVTPAISLLRFWDERRDGQLRQSCRRGLRPTPAASRTTS